MRKVLLRSISVLALVVILASVLAVPCFALSLADAFSGGSRYSEAGGSSPFGDYVTKTAWAQTRGYEGYHYVRAYIGGTSTNPSNAIADTGRVYSEGNNYCECTTDPRLVETNQPEYQYFPIAFAKYGTT